MKLQSILCVMALSFAAVSGSVWAKDAPKHCDTHPAAASHDCAKHCATHPGKAGHDRNEAHCAKHGGNMAATWRIAVAPGSVATYSAVVDNL